MKKLMFLFIGLAVLASCSKDDTTPPDNTGGGDTTEATLSDSLVGKWTLDSSIHYDSVYTEDTVKINDTTRFDDESNYINVKDSANLEAALTYNGLPLGIDTTYELNTSDRSISFTYKGLIEMDLNLKIEKITGTSLTVYLDGSDETKADTTWFYLTKSE